MNPLVQPDPGLYIWTIVVFLGLLWAFTKLAWTPLKAALETREQSIQKALDDARQARQELEKLNVESARILTEARMQADTILSQTRDDASRLREDLRQKAQAQAQTIVKNAERQIELETARALQQIRAETVDLSLAVASKILQRTVSKEDNERFIEDTFKQIEASRRPS
jgi:F-type H+-transporting ATPase subunit b